MDRKLVADIFHPLLQHIYGRKGVLKALRELEITQWYSPAEMRELQLAKLKSLVDYAYERIPYYRRRFDERSLRPSDIELLEDVSKLPKLTKADIKENLSSMVDPSFEGKLIKNTSSGSTGHPIVFYEDGEKNRDCVAEYLRAIRWFGLDAGAGEARFSRLTSEVCNGNKMNLLRKILLNQLILPGMGLSEEVFEDSFQKLVRFRPRILFGITSALHMFTQYILEKRKSLENINLDLIVAWAAPLYAHQRELMEATYDCPVLSLYGTREVGHIAAECPQKGFHINQENLLVELVDPISGNPCRANEPGTVLVTTLNRYCMPFIRYDIGDVGILDDTVCSCGRGLALLKDVVGRTGEILTTQDGKILSPNFWCRMMMSDEVAGSIKQFKVIQKTKGLILIQIVRDRGYTDEHSEYLRKLLADNLGTETKVNFEFVETIPPERSGKYVLVSSELVE